MIGARRRQASAARSSIGRPKLAVLPCLSAAVANLFDAPGKPFGYAWLEERTKIQDHVRRKMGYCRLDDMRLMFRVQAIQDRIHKYDPTFAERCRRMNEENKKRWREMGGPIDFSRAELERLIEHFDGANDPISAGIAEKAKALYATLPSQGD
jgi:hypothetical protein